MKAKLFQISWSEKSEPLNSCDVHPGLPLLATCGNNQRIGLWRINDVRGVRTHELDVKFRFDLTGHARSVNAVRFSPNGEALASAADDNAIIVWIPQGEHTWATVESERHLRRLLLCGHSGDVYDVAWSPDSRFLVSGAVDCTARVWDVRDRREIAKLEGHTQFVQGVAWDPTGAQLVTQSNDRSIRVYTTPAGAALQLQLVSGGKGGGSAKAAKRIKKDHFICVAHVKLKDAAAEGGAAQPAGAAAAAAAPKSQPRAYLFHDDSLPSFFRRPCYSPDGTLLLAPTGVVRVAGSADGGPPALTVPTTLVFDRSRPAQPVAHYPGSARSKPSIVVRACPLLFKPRSAAAPAVGVAAGAAAAGATGLEGSTPAQALPQEAAAALGLAPAAGAPGASFLSLPYRIIIAVATLDSVLVYDSSLALPIAVLSGFHCEKITDVAWAADASLLFIASMDGYVSAASFEPGEFGEPLLASDKDAPPALRRARPFVLSEKTPRASKGGGAKAAAAAAAAAIASAAPGAAAGVSAGGDAAGVVHSLGVKRRLAPVPVPVDAAAAASAPVAAPALPATQAAVAAPFAATSGVPAPAQPVAAPESSSVSGGGAAASSSRPGGRVSPSTTNMMALPSVTHVHGQSPSRRRIQPQPVTAEDGGEVAVAPGAEGDGGVGQVASPSPTKRARLQPPSGATAAVAETAAGDGPAAPE